MRLSCLPVSYFSQIISGARTIESWVEEAAQVGFDGFDLSILFFRNKPDETAIECRLSADRFGIRPAIINTYSDLAHPERNQRKAQANQLVRDIHTAASAGAEFVRIVAGQRHPSTSRQDGIRYVIEGFLQAQEAASNAGIQLVYENHSKPGNWDYSDFSFDPEVFLQIADDIDGSGIQLLFDTANCLVFGIEPQPVLRKIVNRVKCVHAADTQVRGALIPAVIGEGIVPFPDLFAILRSAGFDGWISLEEASNTGKEGVRRGYSFVREMWSSCR